jgi:hypothetical protein
MDLNHSDCLLWSDINTSIPVTGVLKEIIFQDPFHLKLEDWSIYRNCNAFSSSPCLLILDIVSYTKINFNVIYLQCFLLKCIDRKLACRTWQVGQLDRCVSRLFFFSFNWFHRSINQTNSDYSAFFMPSSLDLPRLGGLPRLICNQLLSPQEI